MNVFSHHWIKRDIDDSGEIYYDTISRNVYDVGAITEPIKNQEIYSRSTFSPKAPLKIYFDFTYFCNLECRHCITNSSPRVDRQDELSFKRIISILDELAEIGVLEIGVGGGEPLCRSDIFQHLAYAKTIGLNTILTTNGTLVTSGVARKLNEAGVSEVRVSFDGSEFVHDNIRGAGSYQKALKALRILMDNNVKTEPRITICNDEKEGICKLFKDLVLAGANNVKIGLIFPKGRAVLKENQTLFKYPRDRVTAQMLLDLARESALDVKMVGDLAFDDCLADGKDLRKGQRKSCGAGFRTGYISPYGKVQPCSGMPERVFGSVRTDSFMSSWTSQSAENWRQSISNHHSWFLCNTRTL
jgi:MoaA/NifB/PqqE/SkfB family radical SAM enzyme